jgi:Mg-chelatase subunit ChlI
MSRPAFPFSAIVGQEQMRLALLLSAVNPHIGGVLIRGERGTAKSTAARALAALLPGGAPFVDLPIGATEDRVVGSFDLEAAVKHGERRFHPGLLASAHGGVLYVDEVNLLDDHLVDLLLDVAASGVNVVEREGIAHRHPAQFVLVGTMNPEEGELRPQLLDRFGLCVGVAAVGGIEQRVAILERCVGYDHDPEGVVARWAVEQRALAERVARARDRVGTVTFAAADLRAIAALAAGFELAGHRAELVMLRAACAAAALDGRQAVTDEDILRVAPLALQHRVNPEAIDEGVATRVPSTADLVARLEAARAGTGDATATEKKTVRNAG